MIQIVRDLFADHTDEQFAVRAHCCKCVAHRILKVGWENGLNYYDARNLILLGMFLPTHCRARIVDEALAKATAADDRFTLDWIQRLFVMGAKEQHSKQAAGAA